MCKTFAWVLLAAFSVFAETNGPARKVYYVAANGCDEADGLSETTAWRTLKKLNASLPPSAEVRLRRGDVFYGPIRVKHGLGVNRPTVVTSFGEGADPVISLYKTAVPRPAVWKNVGDCLWQIDLFDDSAVCGNPEKNGNVGFLLVDGVIHGGKLFGDAKPSRQWAFRDDERHVTVWSAKNPAELSSDIRFAPCVHGIRLTWNLVVSNVTVRGTGGHGVCGVGVNVVLRHCTFKEIGGSWLKSYPAPNVRFGNGVEFWSGSTRALVKNCRFADVYDVAFTMQGPSPACSWEDVHVRGCEIVRCSQAFEVWTVKCRPGIGFRNCSFTGNRCVDTGFCWGYDVRPAKEVAAPLLAYAMETDVCDILVKDNTFINNRKYLIYKSSGLGALPEGYRVEGNRICAAADRPVGNPGQAKQAARSKKREEEIRASNIFMKDCSAE
jgi:hypothetical protein